MLVETNSSPHHYSLKPSDARALTAAELVVWIGPELESFLAKPIATLSRHATSIALLNQNEITVYRRRAEQNGHEHGVRDPHIWLDPINAIAIAQVITTALVAIDPDQARLYESNLQNLQESLRDLNARIENMLKPIKDRPYAVAHDAFQYFEKRYGLGQVIHFNYVPLVLPGAKRVRDVRSEIARRDVRCVFSEPQLGPTWAPVLGEGHEFRVGMLDPLGVRLPAGRQGYELLLMNIAKALVSCLSATQ